MVTLLGKREAEVGEWYLLGEGREVPGTLSADRRRRPSRFRHVDYLDPIFGPSPSDGAFRNGKTIFRTHVR
jgi:hypothetical protein